MLAEITAPVDLCLPSGALNPAAVGWSRTPLHRANLRTGDPRARAATWARTRRSETWTVITPDHVLVLHAASLNYAGLHELWVLDRRTGEEVDVAATVPLARDVRLPSRAEGGPTRARSGSLALAFDPGPDGVRLRALTPRVRVDLLVQRPAGHERLGLVVPWTDRLFHYAVTDVALPVLGRIWVDGRPTVVDPSGPSWAASDFGRGRWPYAVSMTRAAGAGSVGGVVTGLRLGGRWTDGTDARENVLVRDGRLHRVDEDLSWANDTAEATAPWYITGERARLRLDPFHARSFAAQLGVLSATARQSFGVWSGWVMDSAGSRIVVDGLVGWAEEAVHRW